MLAEERIQLTTSADLLMRLGVRVDTSAHMHPVSSILLGASLYLRKWLSSVDSLTVVLSPPIEQSIRHVISVIAGPRSTDIYKASASLADAFDANGAPKAELPSMPLGRGSILIGRIGNFLETYAKIVTATWVIFSTVLVFALIATGRLDLSKWQLQK